MDATGAHLIRAEKDSTPVILSDERIRGPQRAPLLRSMGWRSEESKDPYSAFADATRLATVDTSLSVVASPKGETDRKSVV